MQLSVIILNYNVRFFLEQCLRSVQAALKEIDAEIIVVDNNSQDDSCEMVKQFFPEVILIENQENTGFPKGNNIGVNHAKGKYICILNPDTVVSEDTFTQLLDFAHNQDKKLGVVGCKLIDGTGNFLPESKRNIPTPKVALLKMLGISKKYYANHLSENQIGKASIFVGAFMFIEKRKYLEMNGFDEDFFMYGEDIDLSYRLEKNGYKNYYYGKTTVIHYKGESTNKDKIYLKRFYGAMKVFYKKHFKTNILFDISIDIGIKLFSFMNNFVTQSIKEIAPQRYIFISNDEFFLSHLRNIIRKDIDLIDSINALKANELNSIETEIIFDNSHIPNKEIIENMKRLRNRKFTFKIKPQNASFIIGSNSKSEKGEVIIFNEIS